MVESLIPETVNVNVFPVDTTEEVNPLAKAPFTYNESPSFLFVKIKVAVVMFNKSGLKILTSLSVISIPKCASFSVNVV